VDAVRPEADLVETIGLLLREGDVIVAPDGSEHTVTAHDKLDFNCVTFHTDTGLRVHLTWYEAKSFVYDVRRRTPRGAGTGFSVPAPAQAATDLTTSDGGQ
jgi:hypothetical protein